MNITTLIPDNILSFLRCPQVNYEPPQGLSPELEGLLRSVLVVDPAQRPSVAQLLQNPWVAVALPPGMLQCNEKVWRHSLGV